MMRRLLYVLVSLLAVLAGPARSAGMEPCSYASVFEGAALNALVLPYQAETRDGRAPPPELQLASRQIAALVHLEVLMGLLKYPSIGAKHLWAEPGEVCDVDVIIGRITRAGAAGALRPGQGAVLVWGRLFEQAGEFYLQSYLRFVRQGGEGSGGSEQLWFKNGPLQLRGSLPTQAIAFAPRRISRAELAQVDRDFRQAMVLRPRPERSAAGRAIEFSPHQALAFWVSEVRGEWLKLQSQQGGPGGWVHVTSQPQAAWSLQRWLPELAYVDAVSAFVRLRVDGLTAAQRTRTAALMELGLSRYERAVPADLAPGAWGLASALRGWQAWEQGRYEAALALFELAQAQLPAYAGARQLAALARVAVSPEALNADSAARLSRELMAALALAPDNGLLLGNLERLYAFYEQQRPDWSPFEPEALRERQLIVRAAARRP
ncbi:hypothetical protein OOZ63_03145 [Paucibacter sp. PLA-PC-4]|uniref:hypothetical protein n=1 Tax=Paucibacter sp. PLA-PC-4 TaxID=2993655 RepID=UPI0022489519|nr:hypothetical protein [Paucibacter sp. PLA-PC-4]MCX2860830.1 hypothetical protein [Paucibacter sp. PLA-PC-4]